MRGGRVYTALMTEAIRAALDAHNKEFYFNRPYEEICESVREWLQRVYPFGDSFESWEDCVLSYLEENSHNLRMFGINGKTNLEEYYND